MDHRPTWEREQLREEMNQLEDAVAGLEDNYRLVDRLGEGAPAIRCHKMTLSLTILSLLDPRNLLFGVQSCRPQARPVRQLAVDRLCRPAFA